MYNVIQIVVCAMTFAGLVPFFVDRKFSYGVGPRMTPNPTVEYWVCVYYFCKLLDFFDTFFIVLGKKTRQLTLLHIWHHASIVPLFGFYISHGHAAGYLASLPLWNSLVHVVMYTHYLVTTIFTFKKMWWKPCITILQMCHHVLIMGYAILSRFYGPPDSVSLSAWYVAVFWGLSILG